jgi:hypothetical protein
MLCFECDNEFGEIEVDEAGLCPDCQHVYDIYVDPLDPMFNTYESEPVEIWTDTDILEAYR